MIRATYLLLPCIALTLACATPQNADLDRVNARYAEVSRGQAVSIDTSVDMYDARKNLDHAKELMDGGAEAETVSHYAYMAELRIQLAELSADTRARREEAEQLLAQRQQIRLEARTGEADRASARARAAQASAAEATARAAQATTQAEEEKAKARAAELRLDEMQQQLEDLETRQSERGILLTLGGVLFEFGKADLKPAAETQLSRVAGFLIANPDRDVVIEGHADDVGTDEFNEELSRDRAESVRDYLVLSGVSGSRIVADGFGKRFPVTSNETDAGRAQNRRVELTILDAGISAREAIRR
ncbi:MAG: DUF4398 and OmpA-like domain-containing protein [Deltaproteobacteria bacterium]|nr:DUF4398 and OmpA-like domain-containing protein [Deltaproteobacteria bacterium]MBW2396528.1 DUF4398 and OmpA-like domain-containing protein [Deltaproteobacteria bacterium]